MIKILHHPTHTTLPECLERLCIRSCRLSLLSKQRGDDSNSNSTNMVVTAHSGVQGRDVYTRSTTYISSILATGVSLSLSLPLFLSLRVAMGKRASAPARARAAPARRYRLSMQDLCRSSTVSILHQSLVSLSWSGIVSSSLLRPTFRDSTQDAPDETKGQLTICSIQAISNISFESFFQALLGLYSSLQHPRDNLRKHPRGRGRTEIRGFSPTSQRSD